MQWITFVRFLNPENRNFEFMPGFESRHARMGGSRVEYVNGSTGDFSLDSKALSEIFKLNKDTRF
jgi:hypothetical protein